MILLPVARSLPYKHKLIPTTRRLIPATHRVVATRIFRMFLVEVFVFVMSRVSLFRLRVFVVRLGISLFGPGVLLFSP